jgi:hypothetical protein
MTDSPRPSSQPAAIPADDPKRNLVLVRPDDPNLPILVWWETPTPSF